MAAFVGFIFMLFFLLKDQYIKRKKITAGLLAMMVIAGFGALTSAHVTERIRTLEQGKEIINLGTRIKVSKAIIKMIHDHPFLGIGPGNFSTVFTRYQPPGLTMRYTMGHNDYLHFISETGVALVGIVVWMVVALYHTGIRKLTHPSRLVRGTTLGALSGITAMLCHSFVDFNLHIPSNAMLFVVLAATVALPTPTFEKANY